MASHLTCHSCQSCKKWLVIWTVYGLEALLLFRLVEHVFVINLVYWMLAFDARTAEKNCLENGAEPSGKKGRVGKGLRVLVTLGYASLRVHFTWPSVNLPIEGTAQKKQGSTVWAVGKENWKTLFLYGAGTVTPHFHTHKCRFCQCISMGMHLFWQKSRMADRPTSKY